MKDGRLLMRCSTVCSLLDDHLDGILPAEQSNAIRGHLDTCPTCDTEAELSRCVTAPLSAWGDLEPPAGCFESILARIDALPPKMHVPAPPPPAEDLAAYGPLRHVRGGARWFMTSGAAAAAVLLAAAAVERAGDLVAPDRTGRHRPVAAQVGSLGMRAGELPLTFTGIFVSDDMEQRDGLLRRWAARASGAPGAFRGGSALDSTRGAVAAPVSADPFGASPR